MDGPLDWSAVDPFDSADPYFWVRLEHLGRYLFALDHFLEIGVKRVLDAGTGVGYGSRLMAGAGLDVTAVDADPQRIAYLKESGAPVNIHAIVADIEQVIPGDADFEGIVSFEVLEHLRDPRTALSRLAARLRPSGTFVCSVPSRIWESRMPDGLPGNTSHRIFFGRQEIIALIESCGLVVSYVLGQGLCNYLMKREESFLALGKLSASLAEEPALNAPERLEHLARLLGYPTADYAEWSYSFIVVAAKPASPHDDKSPTEERVSSAMCGSSTCELLRYPPGRVWARDRSRGPYLVADCGLRPPDAGRAFTRPVCRTEARSAAARGRATPRCVLQRISKPGPAAMTRVRSARHISRSSSSTAISANAATALSAITTH
jgi:SAM-dependent methyltransferase